MGQAMDYWLIKTGPDGQPGINGGMVRRQGKIDGQAVIAYVCTIDVASLDQQVKAVQSKGDKSSCPKCRFPALVGWPMPRIRKEISLG